MDTGSMVKKQLLSVVARQWQDEKINLQEFISELGHSSIFITGFSSYLSENLSQSTLSSAKDSQYYHQESSAFQTSETSTRAVIGDCLQQLSPGNPAGV